MRTATKLAGYAAGLVVVFGAATGLGALAGPFDPAEPPAHAAEPGSHGHEDDDMDTMDAASVSGLEVSVEGYTLVPATTTPEAGAAVDFWFRIDRADGSTLTRYEVAHDKELHLIVVRRDLAGYQHLHPTRAGDGTWSVPVDLATPGTYRVLADFRPEGRDESLTLGVDVFVRGLQETTPLPAPDRTATVDGYTVHLAGSARAGRASTLTLEVARDGRPVGDLEPYLGAYGHLVALRSGDLAYLHVHPDGEPGDGHTSSGPAVVFKAEVPSAGTFRLYFDFRHDGAVHAAEFTVSAS